MMSGRFSKALRRVPTTNPSCTESVSQLAALALRCHSFVNAGTTAEPLNQRDMASSSAMANSVSVRQREPGSARDSAELRKAGIVATDWLGAEYLCFKRPKENAQTRIKS